MDLSASLNIKGAGELTAANSMSNGQACVGGDGGNSTVSVSGATVNLSSDDSHAVQVQYFQFNSGTVRLSGNPIAQNCSEALLRPASGTYHKLGHSSISLSDAETNTVNCVTETRTTTTDGYVFFTSAARPVLPAPTGVEWDAVTPARATWTAVSGAEEYSVQLYKDGVASGSAVTTADTSCGLSDRITAAGAYTFKVTALPPDSSLDMASEPSAVSDSYMSYAITYNLNGGDPGMVQLVQDGPYVGNPEYCHAGMAAFTLYNPTKFGYTFTGWTGSNGETKQTSVTVTPSSVTAALSYTANWSARQYTVKYHGNGSTSGTMADSTHTYDTASSLTANAYKREYTVTYDHNYTGDTDTSGTASYSFQGWNSSADGTGSTNCADGASVTTLAPSGTFDLYAKWASASVTLPTPTRTGYAFSG